MVMRKHEVILCSLSNSARERRVKAYINLTSIYTAGTPGVGPDLVRLSTCRAIVTHLCLQLVLSALGTMLRLVVAVRNRMCRK